MIKGWYLAYRDSFVVIVNNFLVYADGIARESALSKKHRQQRRGENDSMRAFRERITVKRHRLWRNSMRLSVSMARAAGEMRKTAMLKNIDAHHRC